MTRTLVIPPNWVGDVVMAAPVFAALGASGREVVALTRPGLAPLVAGLPGVHSALERAADESRVIEDLRAERFAEAVILPNSFRSAWLPYRAGIPARWGYRGQLRGRLLAPGVRRPATRGRPQIEDYADLLRSMGVAPPADWTPRLEASAEALARGREALGRAGLEPGAAPIVGLFAGAEFGPSKRWDWRRFAALAGDVGRLEQRPRPIVLAGPKEVWLAVRIHEESGKRHPVIGADLDLAGLAGVLAHLDLLVTNDSGPMHLAAALGVPCVSLFGPTDPTRTRPAGERHQVLYTDRWCSPCFRRRCPLIRHRCLRDIEVSAVLAACERSLRRE